MRRKVSAAEGRRFGSTSITPEKSQFDIQGVLTKYGAEASQWTVMPSGYTLRFVVGGRSYLFEIPRLKDDPQEVRRLFRVVYWYLDTMLAAMDAGLFTPEKVFLAFLEVAPNLTLHSAMERSDGVAGIRKALGGGQLALEAPAHTDEDEED
jgi:hypothetical protein